MGDLFSAACALRLTFNWWVSIIFVIQNTIRCRTIIETQTGDLIIMLQIYNNVMNSNKNPLSVLPPAQRMQAMIILSVMWSTIFSLSTGAWLFYGELVVGHVLAIVGIGITAMTFHDASKKDPTSVPVTN
jgi:hypothetical protein